MSLLTLKKRALVCLCAAMGLSLPAVAQLAPVIESFDYASGSALDGQNGGSGFSGAWSGGSYNSDEPGLSYPGVISAGLAAWSFAQSGGNAFRDLADTWGEDGTTFYFSAIMQKTSEEHPSRYFGLALYRDNSEVMLLGQTSGFAGWALSGTGLGSSAVSSQTQSLLVVRVDAMAGGDTITLWINPDLSLTEAENTPVGISTTFDLGTINRIRIGGGNANQSQPASANVIDEIRFSGESPFVIPEPATLPLLASIAAAAFAWKMRRA